MDTLQVQSVGRRLGDMDIVFADLRRRQYVRFYICAYALGLYIQ